MKVSPSITTSEPGTSTRAPRPPPPRPRPSRLRKWRGFLLAVMLPFAIAAGYLYGLAADQYSSEARILVRGSSAPVTLGGLGSALSSAGFRPSTDETLAVRDFLRSGDAIRSIASSLDLVAIWRRPEADFLAQLWHAQPTGEQLLRYYNRMVSVDYDTEANAVTLLVKTFRAADSRALAEALLGASETLVNNLSLRQRTDTVATARSEVGRAEARVLESREAVIRFRQNERAIDPTREVGGNMEAVVALETALTQARAELQEKSAYLRTDNPQLRTIANRIAALGVQINAERQRITAGDQSLPQQLAGYERLLLEREFADRQLASATSSLESARIEADRQQLWLSRIIQPQTPDSARYPRVIYILLSLFAVLAALYGLAVLLMSGFREHAS